MNDELQKLIQIESNLLDQVTFDVLGIPKDKFRELGSSALHLLLVRQGELDPDEEIAIHARNEFDLLCRSAPNISRDAIDAICLASTLYELFFGVNRIEAITRKDAISTLWMITMMRGFAMGAASSSPAASEIMRKMMLSMAGLSGSAVKHSKPRALKAWAEQEAKTMKGSDMDIARQLAAKVPEHLADASGHPWRLIYDHLRALRRRLASQP